MNEREEHLIQQALLEGEESLGPKEAAELRELLVRDQAAAATLAGLRRTATLAASVPPATPPDWLAQRISAALPPVPNRAERGSLALAALAERCPYYCFLAGFLHLLLGFTLQNVLLGAPQTLQLPRWLLFQPDFAFATGCCFLLAGGLLLLGVPHAARIIHAGLVVYIVGVAANGLALQLQLQTTRQQFFGLLSFVGMGLTIGLLLGHLLQHYPKEVRHHG